MLEVGVKNYCVAPERLCCYNLEHKFTASIMKATIQMLS